MKKLLLISIPVISVILSACASEASFDDSQIIAWPGDETFSDSGAFLSHGSSFSGGDVICRYSAENGLVIPLCGKPDCTHNIKTSPNCGALANRPKGICAAGGKLYFTELDKETDDMKMICADINGENRRTVAVIEHGALSAGFIDCMRYQEGQLIYTSYDIFDTEAFSETYEYKPLDKYIATVRSIDTASGEIKVLAKKQDYYARISNAVIYDDTLIYFCSWHTEPADGENDSYSNEKWAETYRYGVYTVDLKTGEEKCLTEEYERMALAKPCFDHFSYDRLIFYSTDTDDLYKYNKNEGTFTPFAKCADINSWYISDDRSAIFLENEKDEYFCRYDFESEEITKIPREGFTPIWFNGTITGEKAWFGYKDDDGEYCRGYMNRDDLMNGKYDGFTFAYYVNEEA